MYPLTRLRRTREYNWSRRLVQESAVSSSDLILPIFIKDGKNIKEEIKTMPDVYRYSIDNLEKVVARAVKNEIPAIALFPETKKEKKIKMAPRHLMKITWYASQLRKLKKNLRMKLV